MYKPIFNQRSVLKFKQFTNKGYALFACLGREVVISVLSVATLQHATAAGVSIETDKVTTDSTLSSRQVMLEEVNVVGTRAPLTLSQQARMVTVLSREDIQAAPVQSVNDLLKYVAGVDVRQRGPLGAQTDVSIRGSNSEQVTILLNGINICDPQTGHNVFDIPVDISDIERIEVLEGPAGRVYGTSSLLGAINIVTKGHASLPPKPTPTGKGSSYGMAGEVRVGGGSYGYFSMGGRLAWGKKKLKQTNVSTPLSFSPPQGGVLALRASFGRAGGGLGGEAFFSSLSASYTRSDGYSRNKAGGLNADFNGGKAFYQGGYSDRNISVKWHAGLTARNFGSNTFYGVSSDDQFEHTFKTYTAVQAETKVGRLHLRPAVYWNHQYDRFEYFRGEAERVPFNYHRTDIYGLNLNSYFDWAAGRTAIGMEMRNEDLVSGNLGEPLDHPKHIHGTDRYYMYGLNRTNVTFIAEHNILLRRFTLSAGIIAVKNSWADMGMKCYPSADMSYRIGRDWKVYASYNTSLRMPSATELYYSVGGHKADKHLKPEELSAVEAGVKVQNAAVTGKLSVFYNHHRNLIDWIRHTDQGPDAPWESVNFGRINAVGVETAVDLNLQRLFNGQQLLRRFSLNYCYISQEQREEEGVQSKYALEYLRHKLTATLQMKLWKALHLALYYRVQDRTGTYTDTNGNVRNYAGYGVVDGRLTWEKPRYQIHVAVNNLFGKQYVDYGNVPQPGTWLMGGIRISLP